MSSAGRRAASLYSPLGGGPDVLSTCGDFGDYGVSFVAAVAGRYTRRGGPRLSVQGEPLISGGLCWKPAKRN